MRTKQTLLIAALTALFGGVAAAGTGAGDAKANVNFEFDSAELPMEADATLTDLAAKAQACGNRRIVIDGHTDPVGTGPYNIGLSLRRAEAVKEKLTGLGVASDRIVISAYGEDKPSGATNADNRRVDISMTKKSVNEVVSDAFENDGTSVHWDKPMTTAQLEEPAAEPDAPAVATR